MSEYAVGRNECAVIRPDAAGGRQTDGRVNINLLH